MKNKKAYENVEVEVIKFEEKDIVLASGVDDFGSWSSDTYGEDVY